MSIRFIPVAEINDPLTLAIGLSGGSGTGKTYTALRMARGIAETITGKKGAPIGFVDTENRRALHYRQAFPEMVHFDMTALDESGAMVGFNPERWIDVIDAAEAAGLPVIVVDSFSHAWEGVNGVLELQAFELERLVSEAEKRAAGRYTVDPAKFSQLAWAAVKPRYRRLIDRIVRAKTNIIMCTRAKPVMQSGFGDKAKNARSTKTRREDVPWDPASDGDLMFEMTTMVILDPKAPGCPTYQIKVADQFKGLLDVRRQMDESTGRAMAEWALGLGDAQKQKEAMDAARAKAREGGDVFRKWWSENLSLHGVLTPIKEELRGIFEAADAAVAESASGEFDAFTPTPEQLAAAEAEALAAIRESDEQAQAAE